MADEIRDWFEAHEDGELAVSPSGMPWNVVFPSAQARVVVYTTKFQALGEALCQRAVTSSVASPMGLLARYGLPSEEEIPALKAFVGNRRFWFVGDADPCDLLIFAWLRARLEISYRGLSDLLLERCGVLLEPRIMLGQSVDEMDSHGVLEKHLPDWREMIGPKLAGVLTSGKKVEAEVLMTCRAIASGPFDIKALYD